VRSKPAKVYKGTFCSRWNKFW